MQPTNQILQGDALQTLKTLESNSVDCIITSPPYWALRDYKTEGQIWDENPNSNCEHDFSNITRPKPTGNVISSKTTLTGGKDKIRQSGGIIQSSFCSKCNAWKGQLGQEPTIDLYIKHLTQIFTETKRVLKKEGTCWIVLGDTYHNALKWTNKTELPHTFSNGNNRNYYTTRRMDQNIPEKCLCLIPERFAISMVDAGWVLRNKIIWYKKNCMPSSAKDRFTVDYEYIYFFTKSQKYCFKTQYEKSESYGQRWAGDIFRMDKNSKYKDANELSVRPREGRNMYPNGHSRIKRCVWQINTKPFPQSHFAVFPEQLVEQCLDAGCPTDGITLDTFMGSGTTALVALKHNRKFIGIELNPEYIQIAMKRIEPYLLQTKITTEYK